MYGVLLGCSIFNYHHQLGSTLPCKYKNKLRSLKQLTIMEKTQTTERNETGAMKLNGKLELGTDVVKSKIDKWQFVNAVKDKTNSTE